MTIEQIDAQIADIVAQLNKPVSERFSGAAGDLSITRRSVEELEKSLAVLRAQRTQLAGKSNFSLASFRKS